MANSNHPLSLDQQSQRQAASSYGRVSSSGTEIIDNSKYLTYKNLHISTIQSLVIIATGLVYYCNNSLQFVQNNIQFGLIILPIGTAALLFTYFSQGKKIKPKAWHFLIILSTVAFVFNYEATVHAQILDGIDGALGDVGTAAGGSIAATILDAVIDLIRIAVYVVVAGAVIAAIAFGVIQAQWQAPVLVVGTIIAIGLFLELMGVVVFG